MGISSNKNNREFDSFEENPNDLGTDRRVVVKQFSTEAQAQLADALSGGASELISPRTFYQGNPGTSATVAYELPADTEAILRKIVVVNTSSDQQVYRIYFNPSGTSLGNYNVLAWHAPLDANETKYIDYFIPLTVETATIAVWGSTTDVVFTVTGYEITEP
ncbi:hypothetical protein EKK58_08570 [Candidatus Dependentiae bacterium]|nr:MAG: hypothetical protein EKK58_08570 [Candidatus Dependentiae bacterium]